MPKLASTRECTGCTACYAVCPYDALSIRPDCEGFAYPVVDSKKCVECGLCTSVCPVLKVQQQRMPLGVYAAYNLDNEARRESSSGGVFSLLALHVISQRGIIYGAGWNQQHVVCHKSVETVEALSDLRGSKYVQSDLTTIFRDVKKQLDEKRDVLFSGAPCQIAGLRSFLGREYSRLICVDFICHGVPSPLVFKRYLQAQEKAFDSNIVSVSFRDKTNGWKQFCMWLLFTNGVEYRAVAREDPFAKAFLADLFLRPSCHRCAFRELKSGADLTLGDFWKIHTIHAEMDDDKGTSVVLVNTTKGMDLWSCIKDRLVDQVTSFDDVVRMNPAIVTSYNPHKNRAFFFRKVKKRSFSKLIESSLRAPFYKRVLCFAGRIKRLILRKGAEL